MTSPRLSPSLSLSLLTAKMVVRDSGCSGWLVFCRVGSRHLGQERVAPSGGDTLSLEGRVLSPSREKNELEKGHPVCPSWPVSACVRLYVLRHVFPRAFDVCVW